MKPDFLFPTDEDLELKKPKLFQFKAEPEVITPIGASTLSWQTDAEGTPCQSNSLLAEKKWPKPVH